MNDKEYFSHLYEIARYLNKEFSLHSALRKALEKTVELLRLETGWIWLVQEDTKSVYLAASYNLPPALSRYPERLSGRCFCIDRYLANGISKARNISEITCTRLQNISSGTRGLKFHATIPITIDGRKVGLINLVSKETQQLDEKALSILNTISELLSIAIRRTRAQDLQVRKSTTSEMLVLDVLNRVLEPGMEELVAKLKKIQSFAIRGDSILVSDRLSETIREAEELYRQLFFIQGETQEQAVDQNAENNLHYPTSPLTARELEALTLVKKGYTNKQIAEQLFISERTVKFHISSILSKLLAHTRTEAVETATQRGLLGV
ncbi:GAF domain-containing protein [Mariniphaga sediminis]|uniref:GAF domain-containing protein n=1 Tax=Mariniphaga sediminis TaxID=1628158 RepID=A0A399D190_9BACT|nr:LuxR C-terminal-related transcriptional regulator [Mariniphaga sediminis]RIH65327.1 GAF domain-containing protein [Mariniphaga sediminis]